MAHAHHSVSPGFLTQLPVSAVVLNRQLAERMAEQPAVAGIAKAKKFLSDMLTVALLAISVFGVYEIASLLSPAHHQAATPAAATTAAAPVTAAPVTKTVPSLPHSVPTGVTIPSIGVDASVLSVGMDDKGSIEVPGPNDVGWYNLSPTPGEIGPAILVGHVDYVTTGAAVFWNLRKMQPGDTVQIARQDGKTVTFKVDKVESYGQDNFPSDQVYGNLSYPGLRLITCTGDFNYVTHHYSDNLVVYARAQLYVDSKNHKKTAVFLRNVLIIFPVNFRS